MEKECKIMFRVTETEYRLIQLKKESKGYRNLSQFIRDMLLKDSLAMEKMITEIYNKIIK